MIQIPYKYAGNQKRNCWISKLINAR